MITMVRRYVALVLMALAGCSPATEPAAPARPAPGPVAAPTLDIPPKTDWTASSSEPPEDQYAPAFICDGRTDTRWSSPASDPQWVQVDLHREADVCGATIVWETAFSSSYAVELSTDGATWVTGYATDQGDGFTDDLYFTPVRARYVRILGRQRATQWGHSIWELDLKGPSDVPLVTCNAPTADDSSLLFDGRTDTTWRAAAGGAVTLDVDLRRTRAFGGVRLDWGDAYASNVTAAGSTDGTTWHDLATLREGTGGFDILLFPHTEARHLRLMAEGLHAPGHLALREISLRGPEETLTPEALYRIAAAKAPRGVYPLQFLDEQVYWTLLAVPGDRREGLLDEYGNVEPWQGASMLMPYVEFNGRLWSATDAVVTQRLEEGFLPLPSVAWQLPGASLDVQAFAAGTVTGSAIYVQYTVRNTGDAVARGRLLLAVRPVQVNPTWQHGGLSPIHSLAFAAESNATAVILNDTTQYLALTTPSAFGVRAFDRGDIARDLVRGVLPAATELRDAGDWLSGALAFDFDLEPGAARSVLVASPLHGNRNDVEAFLRAGGRDPGAAFASRLAALRKAWRQATDRVVLDLPESVVVDTVKSQIGYILGNMDGLAIQPGSRNYKRSWIRDGGVTSIALLRMGVEQPVREFLEWYAARVQPDGLVPPILNNDGTINDGYGSEREYDSQGEFVHAITEFYRLTGDRDFLAAHFKQIERALRHLVTLRERTLAPDYLADEPARERFVGILPPSYSHEGYNPPMHSYWDDFWALKGWKDGRDAANVMGRPDLARWAEEQYGLLRDALRKSIDASIAYKGISFIPGCAEKGDLDATSTAIGLMPCGEMDLLPHDILLNTFDRYYRDVQKRRDPAWVGAFTPYEARNISAFVELGWKDRAADLLDYLLSCRRPPAWNHLAEVVLSDPRKGSYIGDMPHTWVGSDLVNAVRQMIVEEDGGRLALLKGVPARWVRDGHGIRAENMPTHFGRLAMTAAAPDNTLTIRLDGKLRAPEGLAVYWPLPGRPARVTVDGQAWTRFDDTLCRVPAGTREIAAIW